MFDKPSVNQAPEIVKPLEAQVVETGSNVVLDVEFVGVPQPKVEWFRNGKKIITDIETTETKTTLIVKKVTKKTAGRYEVRVSNVAGEAKTSASVTVVGKS